MSWARSARADLEPIPVEGSSGGRFMRLLILMLGMLVLAPLLDEGLEIPLLDDVFLTAVFISAVYSFSHDRLLLLCLVGLAVPALCAAWAGLLHHARWLTVAGGLFEAAEIAEQLNVRFKQLGWIR